jgi:hypothetical protein
MVWSMLNKLKPSHNFNSTYLNKYHIHKKDPFPLNLVSTILIIMTTDSDQEVGPGLKVKSFLRERHNTEN